MIKLMTTKLRLSRQRLSAFCSEETTPTSAHSFLLVKGFSLNNVQTSLCLCLGKCSFPEVVEGKGRIILYFAQRDISCSLVQGCTPTLSSPHHQFGPSKIDWFNCQARVQVQVRWRSGEVSTLFFWPELYYIFGFHPTTHPPKLFFGSEGVWTCQIDLESGMTQLGSEVVRTSRWTPRQRTSGTEGGHQGVLQWV